MHPILVMLSGGDWRSIGRANEAVAMVLNAPELFDPLFAGMLSADPVVRMRSADAVEKVTTIYPHYLVPYKKVLLHTLSGVKQAAVRWHVALLLARLPLSKPERQKVVGLLTGYMNDRSSIVRTMAMQALYDLAERYPVLRTVALLHIGELTVIGTPAMKVRGRKLLARLERLAATS